MGLCVLNGFSFVTEKEHNFSNNENIALFLLNRKEKNPTLSDLTQVFCGSLSLLYKKKNLSEKKCIGTTLTFVSFAAVVWSRPTTLSIPSSRASALRDVAKTDYPYWRSSDREEINIIRLQLAASKI